MPRAATDPTAALAALTEARSLYRGEYLDDCPFYGDGAYVEDRRELLRGAVRGPAARDRGCTTRSAGTAARPRPRSGRPAAADDECPPADAALERLGFA